MLASHGLAIELYEQAGGRYHRRTIAEQGMRAAFGRRRLGEGVLAAGVIGVVPHLAAQARLTLDDVNRMDEAAFVKTFGDVYELSPGFARAAFIKRPFATVTGLHQAFVAA